ncbi:MAG: hypothetical protein ACK4VI_07825 [Alphaproteobacteria bacterium]
MKYNSGQAFLGSPKKSITLMGMSGVGKSTLALKMKGWGWALYSCDEMIGTKFLAADIESASSADNTDSAGSEAISTANISALSAFIGKIGALPFAEFKRRQNLYYEAECAAVREAALMAAQHDKFVHDSSGSLCEITDGAVLNAIGAASLIVYIEAAQSDRLAILQRAQDYPKPLFFPPSQLDAWVQEYLAIYNEIESADDIPPDEFLRWVFPRLFDMRAPKYELIAERWGVALRAEDVYAVQSEADLLALIARALDEQ